MSLLKEITAQPDVEAEPVTEGAGGVVYAIQYPNGKFVAKGSSVGGTSSLPQVRFWNSEDQAQAFLDKGSEAIYQPVDRGGDYSDFKVVTFEFRQVS